MKMTKIVNFIGVQKKRAKKGQKKGEKCPGFFGKSRIKSTSYKISKIKWSYVHRLMIWNNSLNFQTSISNNF